MAGDTNNSRDKAREAFWRFGASMGPRLISRGNGATRLTLGLTPHELWII